MVTGTKAGQVGTKPSFPTGFTDALTFAIQRHGEQLRKGTAVPYVTHPVIVAETLAYYYPDSPALITAGLLHDVVEDADTSPAELEEKFGPEVAQLVDAVTKPKLELRTDMPEAEAKRARWRRQRGAMLEMLATGRPDVLRLKAADALANLKAIARDLETPGVGPAVWNRFKVKRDESLDYYRRIVDGVRRLGNEPLVEALRDELARVERT